MLAAAVTILIAYLVWTAWRTRRSERLLVRVSIATLGLILVQAALGGLTVEEGLKQELVATHLGVAMLQIGLVLLMGRLGGPDAAAHAAARERRARSGRSPAWRSWRCWARSWRAATCPRASCTGRASSTARSTRTWRAGTSSRPVAASSCRSAAARHSTSTSRIARSCTSRSSVLLALFATVVRQRRRLDERWGCRAGEPRLGHGRDPDRAGDARGPERLGRRARVADRCPPCRRARCCGSR